MFLVDSSAWIEYLRPGGAASIKDRIRGILAREEAVTCAIVIVEVLRGTRTARDWATLHEALTALPRLHIDEQVTDLAAKWAYECDRKGKTFSTTDLLIAAAAHGKVTLVHRDRDFVDLASIVDLREEYFGS